MPVASTLGLRENDDGRRVGRTYPRASRKYALGEGSPIEGRLDMVTSPDGTRRRRWTDATIERELRLQSDALGRFPTRSDLVARGLRGLWDAMRSAGGVDAWRERLQGEPSTPSHEDVAVRAYELYAQGAPGDADGHWHTAERELKSQAG